MAGTLRHWKERNGRYSARLVVPPYLRPYLDNKAELEIQLGGDRRTALRNHAAAVASIQRQLGIARQKHEAATGQQSKAPPYPLTAQQIALRDYESQITFDAEIRAHDPRYAQIDPDPAYDAFPFRDGFAGKLSDDELEELVGARIERVRLVGNSDAVKGSPEWRSWLTRSALRPLRRLHVAMSAMMVTSTARHRTPCFRKPSNRMKKLPLSHLTI
ncbi:hypothetical protein [Agrobacterium rubi]|uniref:hypothetical protein n=1 Tax=Agrobacterium rubi TaxID=28099 RepID=UPI001F3A75D4|nr:hypothetical protein [Agrobacterium rubi]MBP1878098.1 hypothetical protein [Agrobacterium rubi]